MLASKPKGHIAEVGKMVIALMGGDLGSATDVKESLTAAIRGAGPSDLQSAPQFIEPAKTRTELVWGENIEIKSGGFNRFQWVA